MTVPDQPRGFSLIETMVVVAILGIIAAYAMPDMVPMLKKVQLSSEADATAAFVGRVQAEAMARKRCARVRIINGGKTLVGEYLNSFNCDVAAIGDPKIVSTLDTWVQFASYSPETDGVTIAFDPEPSETAGELRFRPSGRLWSADTNIDDDDGALKVTHATLTGTNTSKVVAEAQGLVCVLKRGEEPGGAGNDLVCP